jgi:hypothetical protein
VTGTASLRLPRPSTTAAMLNPQWAMTTTPIELLVSRACDASLHEPNYALHLEVATYINEKKANNPRDAAMLIARLACNRNAHVALLALALLDTLVKSCGYPFHLQISTKELLNELVRHSPTAPHPSLAQSCPAFSRLSRAGRRPSASSPQRLSLPPCPPRSALCVF